MIMIMMLLMAIIIMITMMVAVRCVAGRGRLLVKAPLGVLSLTMDLTIDH